MSRIRNTNAYARARRRTYLRARAWRPEEEPTQEVPRVEPPPIDDEPTLRVKPCGNITEFTGV